MTDEIFDKVIPVDIGLETAIESLASLAVPDRGPEVLDQQLEDISAVAHKSGASLFRAAVLAQN